MQGFDQDEFDYYRELFELAPLPYQSLDSAGNFIDVNSAWMDYFGVSNKEQVVGRFFGDIMRESSLPLLGVTFEGFKREGFVSSPVFEGKNQSTGEKLLFAVSGIIKRDEQGEFVRTQCILVDATTRAKAESELEKYRRDLEAANVQLQLLSVTDGLTNLANRRRFDEVLFDECHRAERSGSTLSLAMIDIDFFKKYNDRHGHQAGDQCLKQVAEVLIKNSRRATDCAARYGGEEFAIILPGLSVQQAFEFATDLCNEVRRLQITHTDSACGFVTVSIGVSEFTLNAGMSQSDLIARSDSALYLAKKNGRDRVEITPN